MIAVVTVALLFVLLFRRIDGGASETEPDEEPSVSFREAARNGLRAFRDKTVVRWLVLLDVSDLLLDVFAAFVALYLVDVAGAGPAQAAVAVALLTAGHLAGGVVLIPLLARVRGVTYIRVSAALELVLLPAALLLPAVEAKMAAIMLIGFVNSGWYPVLQAQLYESMPGKSGTVLAAKNVTGMFGSLIPLGLGLVATAFGLQATMWLLLIAPIAMALFTPSRKAGPP